jgi:hypothetical protein
MISLQSHRIDLQDRIDSATRLINATHPASATLPAGVTAAPISREARGLVIVLLFAAYENLLRSVTRTLLEAAIRMRVGNRRLRPGFRTFAFFSSAQSIRAQSEKRLYSDGLPNLVLAADPGGRVCTIDANGFPSDGSFMKPSQIVLWCKIFDLPHPASILRRTWTAVGTIVVQRNGIAHGELTADLVGRSYSEADIRQLISDWRDDWLDFLDVVEQRGSTRDFYRIP